MKEFVSRNEAKYFQKAIFYLSLPVDPYDPVRGLVWSGDKDCLGADPVHVDAHPALNVVQVDVAILGDQVNNTVLLAHLK